MFFDLSFKPDASNGWVGGAVLGIFVVVGVIGSVVLIRRQSGKEELRKGPKSGVTTDPKTHLNGLHMKRDSERLSARQTQPPVFYTRDDDKLGQNPNSTQTSPSKDKTDQGRQKSREDKSSAQPRVSQGPPLPDHTILTKNNELRATAKDLAGKTDILEAEYRSLLGYVNKNINKTRTVSQMDENRAHNRYTDIGKPYSIYCKHSESHLIFQLHTTTTMSS